MKKLFIFLSTIFLAVMTMAAWAQENPKLSYQAVVRDNQNRLLTNSTVSVTINILKPDNAVQYTETFNSVPTNQNGLMSLLIGNKPSWDNVDWIKAKINVKITLPGGMGMVESTSDVSAVPLAISALYADSVNLGAVPQSDWDETNPAKCTFIKNKPNVSSDALCDSVHDCVNAMISDTAKALRLMIEAGGGEAGKLALRVDKFNTHVCDSVKDCVTGWITTAVGAETAARQISEEQLKTDVENYVKDTLAYYYPKTATYDTTGVRSQIKDTADVLRSLIDAAVGDITALTQRLVNDSTNLADNYYTKAKINDTLGKYLGLKALDSLITKSGLVDTASAIRTFVTTNYVSNNDLCDKVKPCVNTQMKDLRDSVNTLYVHTTKAALRDSVAGQINDSLSTFSSTLHTHTNKALLDTYAQTEADLADAVAKKHEHSNKDTLDATTASYTIEQKTKLANIEAGAQKNVKSSWTATEGDSMILNKPTTISGYGITDATISGQAITLGSNTITVATAEGLSGLRDSVQKNITAIVDSSAKIRDEIKDTAKVLRGLITNADNGVKALKDSVEHNYVSNTKLNDTLTHYLGTKALDSLITKSGLADTAKNLRDAINDINTNLCTTVMACDGIKTMRDSIQTNKNAIVANAANIATNTANITTNTTDIATLKEHTTKDALCDSVSSCVATAMDNRGYLTKDSTVITMMQTSIGQNATDIESLQSALVGYAKLADANTYTGNNDFTGGTTRVASGFTFGTTTSETCNNIAVNACDLLVVFDSIQKQFAAMQQQIDGLRDSLQRLRGAVVPAFSSMTFDRTENSLTATADFDDGGATITEYNFCISTSEDMSDAICQTSTESTYTFEDLNPGTQYYMTVAATNLKGTITSDTIGEQTVHSAPELSEATANAISNTEIEVTGTLISMGGTTPTTMTVYAYTNSDYSDAEPIRGTDSTITSAPKEFQLNVSGLTKGTQYYLAVIADNGEKKDTVKTSAITKSVTVVVTSDPEADTIRTGSNVDVTVIYSATVIGEDIPAVDAYLWKVNDTDSTSTSNELTVHFTESGTYKVVCIVNGVSDTAVTVVVATDTITFIPNGGVGSMDKQIVERGVETPLAANGFTHDGWTFKGWNNDYTHTVTYEDTANITTDGNIELYAVWATSCTGTASANETGTDGNISSVKDVCDNEYAVIAIGEQCWMKENLRTTKYADNSNILADNMFAPNNVDSNVAVYGRLYNWAAVMNGSNSSTTNPSDVQGVCPNGWHVPSAAEWDILINYVNGQSQYKCSGEDRSIAKAMSAPTGWIYNAGACFAANLEGNNATGFSAVAAGFHNSNEDMYFGRSANFVTSTESDADNVSYRYVHQSQIFENTYTKAAHLSVRCVRNKEHMVTFKTHEGNLIESKAINGTIEFPGIGDSVKREGYNFNGWNTKIDGSGTHFNVGDEITPTSDTTFYTEWFQCGSETSRVYDSENNGYLTAKIGELCYLAENLRTQIGETGNAYPAAESQDSVAKYGMLYDYEAAQGICPPGWKLPTLEELSETTIENFAIKMAGLYTSDGYSNFFGNSAYFWTSDDNSGLTDAAYYKAFFKFSSAEPNSGSMIKTNAASVRCVFSSTNE